MTGFLENPWSPVQDHYETNLFFAHQRSAAFGLPIFKIGQNDRPFGPCLYCTLSKLI